MLVEHNPTFATKQLAKISKLHLEDVKPLFPIHHIKRNFQNWNLREKCLKKLLSGRKGEE